MITASSIVIGSNPVPAEVKHTSVKRSSISRFGSRKWGKASFSPSISAEIICKFQSIMNHGIIFYWKILFNRQSL